MKKIYFVLLVSAFTSCEIEHITQEEVILAPNEQTPEVILGPGDIIVPCVVNQNTLNFNGSSVNILSIVEESGIGIVSPSNASYSIKGYASWPIQNDIVFYFYSEPVSGEYITTNTTGYMGTAEVKIQTGSYPDYYISDNGGTVYVQNYGDSIRVSYCDIDYTAQLNVEGSQLNVMLIK